MPSSFTWLDHSEQERRRALDVISLFKVRDTRDELGLASIRDAFAEMYFPGTSTIQTRARYFLLVPWLCLSLERKGVASDRAAQRLRWAEEALISRLVASADSDGVIGKEAGKAIKRMPSSIYWAGLRRWGILAFDGSLAQYHRSLDSFYVRQKGYRALAAENREASPEPGNWHAHLPSPSVGFPESASMSLRPDEAEYLQERVLTSCTGTLLAHLISRPASWKPVDFAWEFQDTGQLPSSLQYSLRHAQAFSEVMHGAAILYNLMLARAAGSDEWLEVHEEAFVEWAQREKSQAADRKDWNLTEFWQALLARGARISYTSRAFVEAWVNRVRNASNPTELARDRVAQRLIQEREVALKGGRARLVNPRHLELWSGASGDGQLDLRWRISQRLAIDILESIPKTRRGRRLHASA